MTLTSNPLLFALAPRLVLPPDQRIPSTGPHERPIETRLDPRWPPDDARWIELREFHAVLSYF